MAVTWQVWQWYELTKAVCDVYGVDWRVALSVIRLESAGRPDAVSKAGAVGLMQIMPREAGKAFANRPTKRELLEPAYNVAYGVKLLKELLTYYGGDLASALCAYYMGIAGLSSKGLSSPEAQTYLRAFRNAWRDLFGDTECPV